jgi:hypothetical protein
VTDKILPLFIYWIVIVYPYKGLKWYGPKDLYYFDVKEKLEYQIKTYGPEPEKFDVDLEESKNSDCSTFTPFFSPYMFDILENKQ